MNNSMFIDGNLLKVDADIPLSMMCVGLTSSEYKIHEAWDNYVKKINDGLFGSINELWNEKDGAAFMIVEAGRRLHHTTKKTSGCLLFAELGIKLLTTQKGYSLHGSMMQSGIERIDFFLRGSVDITEYGQIDSVTFKEVTAMCPNFNTYDCEMNKIFNKSLLPYSSYEIQEKYRNRQFPFHKHDDRYEKRDEPYQKYDPITFVKLSK